LDGRCHERIALPFRQRRDFRQRLERKQPALDGVLERLARDRPVELDLCVRTAGSADRGVAEDLVQPAPKMHYLGARPQRAERAQEGLLDQILAPSVGAQPPRERVELATVPLDDHRKRSLVPVPDKGDQPLVRLRAQKQVRQPRAHARQDAKCARHLPGHKNRHLRDGKKRQSGASLCTDPTL
jgi:hypothetical protein